MTAPLHRPYVISWNLTNRCNLKCEHCYLDAGATSAQKLNEGAFADRSELSTEECKKVFDQIASFAPESIIILTGGEPLLRRDILELIEYGASLDLWVVCGTNGVLITDSLAQTLRKAGLRGLSLSLDALDAETHDRFRGVQGAWQNTVNGAKVLAEAGLPFIVQTTVGSHNLNDVAEIADFAFEEMAAKVFNLYFLVPTGRGQFVSDIDTGQYNAILAEFSDVQEKYDGRMIVNAKCAPHYSRHLFENDPDSKFLRSFAGGAGGCPAGTQYLGIRPNGDVTPCPYLPEFGGNVMQQDLQEIWDASEIFRQIRQRNDLKERCGGCEFSTRCGGCRARAYGATGDYMQADPLCEYETGAHEPDAIEAAFSRNEYGLPVETSDGNVEWQPEARERMKQIPAFVRGMVKRQVENYCKRNSIKVVTPEVMAEIRGRMPTPKVFEK